MLIEVSGGQIRVNLNWYHSFFEIGFILNRFKMSKDRIILISGATGYFGGRLVPRLLEAGTWFVALSATRTVCRDAHGEPVEVVSGDALL